MPQIKLSNYYIKNTVKRALNEDLYPSGDITSNLIENSKFIRAKLFSLGEKVTITRFFQRYFSKGLELITITGKFTKSNIKINFFI